MKKLLSVILAALMLMSVFAGLITVNAEDSTEVIDYAPDFVEDNGLYIQGVANSKEAWQKWENYSGLNAEDNVKYFFVSAQAPENEINIYNAYADTAVVNGVTIESGTYASVPYVVGEKASATRAAGNAYTYVVLKSDSSASVYVNDTTGYYEDDEGNTFNNFYEFIIEDKNNSVKGSDVAVVTADGLLETQLKKFKGRGNTNWKYSDKKQFNLQFNDAITIDGVTCKKFSLVNNERDGAVVRNKVIYDVANEVGLPYSTDTRYIDLYINGDYRGCFQASMKVEMGKNSLIALKDTSEDGATEDFNFAVEIDIWNYQNDTHFTSRYGQEIVLNTPELEDYDSSDPVQKAQMTFIQSKYNAFENALYAGNMSSLESICDIESLAKAYLIQEWTKNCDGGLTSTYYTYNAAEGKFYAVPVWDFDSGLGNVDCTRAGASTSTVYYYDWLTKTVSNKGTSNSRYVNTLGRAFKLSGTTSEGKTYLDYVTEAWRDKFIPAIKVVAGQSESTSTRLRSIDQYIDSIENAIYNNYVVWGFVWGPEKGLGKQYPETFEGQVNYLKDWTIARTNWMTKELLGESGELLDEIPRDDDDIVEPTLGENEELYLAGTGFGGWDSTSYKLIPNADRTKATIDFTFKAGETYRFKVAKWINGKRQEHYAADYNDETTTQYFYEDTSSASRNVKAYDLNQDITLTIEFSVKKGSFIAYPQGQEPSEPTQETPAPTLPEPTTEPNTQPSSETPPASIPETSEPPEEPTTEPNTQPSSETDPDPTLPSSSDPLVTEPSESTTPSATEGKKPYLNTTNVKVKAGETVMLQVENNVNSDKVTFTSSDKDVIKVSAKGKITARSKGEAEVKVKVGDVTLTCKVKVTTNPKFTNDSGKKIKKITIQAGAKAKKVLISGKAAKLRNSAYTTTNKEVVKISGGKQKAFVKIKGLKPGKAKVYATINGVKKIKLKVTVK